VLFNEPKLLKSILRFGCTRPVSVSVLFNEPKLLKYCGQPAVSRCQQRFSALQRAEIAEIVVQYRQQHLCLSFSALQRAEIAEILRRALDVDVVCSFSALQRAEIAEITAAQRRTAAASTVSVLFNEPKLLKSAARASSVSSSSSFSALQRAEIAEIENEFSKLVVLRKFQCSSTSRNC